MNQTIFGLLSRQVSPLALSDNHAREVLLYLISRHHQALLHLETTLASDRPQDIEYVKSSEDHTGSSGNSEHVPSDGERGTNS